MDPVSAFPAVAILLLAMATCLLIAKRFGPPPAAGRFASIDGLRGYLALSVFLHHSCLWYFHLRTREWTPPASRLYTDLGQGSVALFFMITGFLFFSKLLDGRTRPLDWGKLFIARFLRLTPLYLFAMLLLFVVVACLSSGRLHEPGLKVAGELARWLGFTVLGAADINGIDATSTIVAGVTWSLPYEWFFYLSLPVLALTVGVRSPPSYIALSALSIVGLVIWRPEPHHLMSFLGGIAAAFLVRVDSFRELAVKKSSSLVLLGCICVAIAAFPSTDGALPILLLSVAFAIIAGGNSLFGLLHRPVSRTLGEMTYSIYLLHGIILFVTFNILLGVPASRAFSLVGHWLVVAAITPLLILGAFATFRLIERPAMQRTTALAAWLRSRPHPRLPSEARSTSPVPLG